MVDLTEVSTARLEKMAQAAEVVVTCQRVLAKAGANLVGDLLKGEGTFYQMTHYPQGDVYDHETHSQYYYHAHRAGEHGHFHLFLRPKGMPDGIKPAQVEDFTAPKDDNEALSHLIAISMDPYGLARSLFSTNRWVTAEYWYKAEDVIALLDHFQIDHAVPSWPVNMWLGAMVQLFYPQICDLLHSRDAELALWKEKNPTKNAFEDRDLEITSEVMISVDDQHAAILAELAKRSVIK